MKNKCLTGLILFLFLFSCSAPGEIVITGRTMGTSYNIKIISPSSKTDVNILKNEIEEVLRNINKSMSVYDKTSEISMFNRLSTNEKMKISILFSDVLEHGGEIYRLTNGKWDATIEPLVRLWGFGSKIKEYKVPEKEKICEKLSHIGFDKIIHDYENQTIAKKIDGVLLDLGSIAKGYGVDRVALKLKELGHENFMVEIGGEIYVSGRNIKKEAWAVGINNPFSNASKTEVHSIVALENKAIATSGTYRNFFDYNGKRYSHLIDPTTGWPVESGIVSISVIAENCTIADGFATGFFIMGSKEALDMCEKLDNVECMIIEQARENSLKIRYSKGFKSYLR